MKEKLIYLTPRILPFILIYIVGFTVTYCYFSEIEHIKLVHEYEGKVDFEIVKDHIKKGCDDFGTSDRE